MNHAGAKAAFLTNWNATSRYDDNVPTFTRPVALSDAPADLQAKFLGYIRHIREDSSITLKGANRIYDRNHEAIGWEFQSTAWLNGYYTNDGAPAGLAAPGSNPYG